MEYAHIATMYDAFVQTTFDVPFFVNEAKRSSGRVLELMSGTGRVSLPLVEAGVNLTCVDRSSEMLAILREKFARRNLSAVIQQMDVCALELQQKFDLIIIPFHSFAEIVSPEDERQALVRIREHLADNGRFICTLHNPKVRARSIDSQLQFVGKYSRDAVHGTLLFWLWQDYDRTDRQVVGGFEFFEEYDVKGVLQSKRMMEMRFRLLEKTEFEKLVSATGFRVIALYGDYAYSVFDVETSPYMIFVLGHAHASTEEK